MELLEPVQSNLERFVLAMTRDAETARDVIGETVLIAYERFDTLRNPRAFLSFLFTIAVRVNRAYRRKAERTEPLDETTLVDLLAPGISPEVAADISAVYDALRELPEKQREAVVLFEIMGVPMKEIREVQGGTLTAVKVRISRGRKRLAVLLGVDDSRQQDAKERGSRAQAQTPAAAIDESHIYSIGVRP